MVLIMYSGKYVKIYFNMKITLLYLPEHIHTPARLPHFLCALWNDYKGVCEGGNPSEGVSNGSVGS